MAKMVLLNSGGMDSLATAIILHKQNHELHSLYVDMYQPNRKQGIAASKKIAKKYCKSHEVLDLFQDDRYIRPIKTGPQIPWMGHLAYLIGAIHARCHEIDYVAGGLKSDSVGKEFNAHYMNYLRANTLRRPITLIRPLDNIDDFYRVYDIIKDDKLLKHTWSCNDYPKCKKCGKCKLRKKYSID